MRWLFTDKDNLMELSDRNSTKAQIKNWWKEFQKKEEDIISGMFGRIDWDPNQWMSGHLHPICEDLIWEFGPGDQKKLSLSLSAPLRYKPLLSVIMKYAPEMPRWEFYAPKPAFHYDKAKDYISAVFNIDLDDIKYRATIGEHNFIDIELFSKQAISQEESCAILLTLMGDSDFNCWLGTVYTNKIGKITGMFKGKDAAPLRSLRTDISTLIDQIKEEYMPGTLYRKLPQASDPEHKGYSVLTATPQEMDDYPGQKDALILATCHTNVMEAIKYPRAFHSKRFSKFNEQFCYLKIDGTNGLEGCVFDSSEAMEIALDIVLQKTKLGCIIGTAIGLRYSYIELAVTDIIKVAELLKKFLSEAKVPKRTWLLFHDIGLSSEWVGIYDDTPWPPA